MPRHLAQVLAQHEFQEAFKNYRDLRFLAKNLDDWHDKLGVFDDMLATRRKAFAERLPQVQARAGEPASTLLGEAPRRRRRGDRARASRPPTASPSPMPSSSTLLAAAGDACRRALERAERRRRGGRRCATACASPPAR